MSNTVSLGTAEQLKAAGWPQGSTYWVYAETTDFDGGRWLENGDREYTLMPESEMMCGVARHKVQEVFDAASDAPDSDDLLEALPHSYDEGGHHYLLNIYTGDTKGRTKEAPSVYKKTWNINYVCDLCDSCEEDGTVGVQTPFWKFEEGQLAEAAAHVWLELKARNLI